jgi:hypothetical protein
VLAPVHDADHDGANIGSDLDEVETLLLGEAPGFFDGYDADLLAVGIDQADGTQTDLVVDTDFLVDSPPPIRKDRAPRPGLDPAGRL